MIGVIPEGPTDGQSADHRTRQYLTFSLGAEEYGVEILTIREIREWSAVTPIPNAPRFLKGVMNLRGVIVPVVDLRSRLGLPEVDPSPLTVVIMVSFGGRVTGLRADTVLDVLTIPDTAIEAPPGFAAAATAGFVKGTAKVEEKLIVLLDIDRVLSADGGEPRRGAPPRLP